MMDPNRLYLWDWIPGKGRLGGVLTGISTDKYDVGVRRQGDFILQHILWDKQLKVKWALMNVYGAPQDDRKDAFLAELASFFSKTYDPYIVGGDSNIIRYSSKKIGMDTLEDSHLYSILSSMLMN
jgi:hypothetical protein